MADADTLRLLGRRGVMEILECLEQEGRYYTDLRKILDISTLNACILELLKYRLIQYCSIDCEEWYSLTEKGCEILELMRELETFLE